MPIAYETLLNPEQLRVVREGDGPCLVLAGAGSGKTRTIVYRVAHLLERGALPQEILLLTFTNKAAKEMLSRVADLLGAAPKGLWGGTFHGVANRILRHYAEKLGFSANFTILDADDSRSLIRAAAKEAGVPAGEKRFPSPAVLSGMWSFSRNACVPLARVIEDKYPRFLDIQGTLEGIFARYEAKKRAGNCMDFDDLLINIASILRDAEIRKKLAGQFRFILVDEFQDTNRVQAEIVTALAGIHNNVLVVGDDAQSIYSFRAAEVRNILDFPRIFPGAKVFRLETNYRSTPEILDLANAVIANNTNQFSKTLKPAPSRSPTDSSAGDQSGSVGDGMGAVSSSLKKPVIVVASTPEDEAVRIVEAVERLREEGTPLSQIAVLFRAAHHSHALEFELARRGIPFEYRGGMRFFERAHVKDALAFLRVVANPRDAISWQRILRLASGIGADTAAVISEVVHQAGSLEEALACDLSLPPRGAKGFAEIAVILKFILKAGSSPAAAIRALIGSGYAEYLEAEYQNAAERIEDLEELARFAESFDSISGFVAEASLQEGFAVATDRAADHAEERMVLSTIHQAKGLEWDAVFVMCLLESSFPNSRALLEEGGEEEERRLFYVAVTRARRELFLTYPRVGGGGTAYFSEPSRFLSEIPDECLAAGAEPEEWKMVEVGEDGELRTRKGFLRDVDEL